MQLKEQNGQNLLLESVHEEAVEVCATVVSSCECVIGTSKHKMGQGVSGC